MSQFSRRARWLNTLFPASVAPQVRDPGQRSDDVSLVQPYDGGGYGYQTAPAEWFRSFDNAAAAAGSQVAFIVPENQVYRIIGAHCDPFNGVVYDEAQIAISNDAGGGGLNCIVSDLINPGLFILGFTLTPGLVVGPELEVLVRFGGGNGASQAHWNFYGIFAPLGTVFPI